MIIEKYFVRRCYYIINTVLRSAITYNGEYDHLNPSLYPSENKYDRSNYIWYNNM